VSSLAQSAERRDPRQALLDAAERLLIEVGYAGITTRRLAAIAGVNHGLVHYYFGSMENVLASTLERFTDRLLERQRAMYEADVPFIERWRTAMGYLQTDQDSGYQKVWLELMALAWNRAELRERTAAVTREWHELLIGVFARAMDDYGLDRKQFPVQAVVALVRTFNFGIILEQHHGITEGHRELLDWIDGWLQSIQGSKEA